MSPILALPSAQAGRPTCPLNSPRQFSSPTTVRALPSLMIAGRRVCSRALLPSLPGRKVGVSVLSSLRQCLNDTKCSTSLLAPLPRWCHRLAGALILVPFLVFGGSRHAAAHLLGHPNMNAHPIAAATVQHNPRFATSTAARLRQLPQLRAAAALAATMVAYGFVRRGSSTAGASPGGPGRTVVVAAAGTSLEEPPPAMPPTTRARAERLNQLYNEIEELKRRNLLVWELATAMMEEDSSLSAEEATVKAAESVDLEEPVAAAVVGLTTTAAPSPLRPSGEAARGAIAAADVAAASLAATAVTTAEAGTLLRPSGGASRLGAGPVAGPPTASEAPEAGVSVRPSGGASRQATGSSGGVPRAPAGVGVEVPVRPSGGASRLLSPTGSADDLTVEAEARASLRPSSGASRLVPPAGAVGGAPSAPLSDCAVSPVPLPGRPGGASARSGPWWAFPASSPSPPTQIGPSGSSGLRRQDDFLEAGAVAGAGGAGGVLGDGCDPVSPTQRASSSPPSNGGSSGSSPRVGKLEVSLLKIFDKPDKPTPAVASSSPPPPPSLPPPPLTSASPPPSPSREAPPSVPSASAADTFRPCIRPTRRASGAGARSPRTYRSIAPPPPPLPPPPAPRPANPSFDVPDDALPAAAYLQDVVPALDGGRTADGRFNPSFALTEAATPAGPSDDPASAADASAGMPASAEAPAAAAGATAATDSSPATGPVGFQPEPEGPVWYNPFFWFIQRSGDSRDNALGGSNTNPSFGASLAVVLDAPAAAASLAEPLVRQAETDGGSTGSGVGTSAASASAPSAAGSDAPTDGAPPNDGGPVERVMELLEVAMKTEELAHPKYDPLRNLMANASAPSTVHKYDMISSLLRAGKEEAAQHQGSLGNEGKAGGGVTEAAETADRQTVGSQAPSKYDVVGALLKAVTASPRPPSRYDPVRALLQAAPHSGRSKYCLAEAVLRGGWQQPLEAGLRDLPAWDPMSALVGSRGAARRVKSEGGSSGSGRRRTVSKYDMVGQALSAAAALPEDLASGKWAAAQRQDLFLGAAKKALEGRAAKEQKVTAHEGRGWGFVRRIQEGGSLAVKAVSAAAAPVGNLLGKVKAGASKAIGRRAHEVIVEGSMEGNRTESAATGGGVRSGKLTSQAAAAAVATAMPVRVVEELPPVLFTFEGVEGNSGGRAKKRAGVVAGPAAGPVTVTAKRPQRAAVPPSRTVAAAAAAAGTVADAPADARPERGIVPPLRVSGSRMAPPQQVPFAQMPSADPAPAASAGAPASEATATPAAADSAPVSSTSGTASPPMDLPELATDLLVLTSVQKSSSAGLPSLEELLGRFGQGFAELAAEVTSLRSDGGGGGGSLMERHPSVMRLARIATSAAATGTGKGVWSTLYGMPDAVADAEAALPAFLEDCRTPYPLLYGLLTAGSTGQGLSVLCALCALVSEDPSQAWPPHPTAAP